ncbi:MAG: hypothetical protein HYV35_09540 [Lentisphaerae bacterium]|nr:hypothetical protein [Lentisphaerota bacterium]
MNLLVMAVALLVSAALQLALPGLTPLGQAKAPLILSVVLYYALHRSLALMAIAAIAGGVLCDSLEELPMGFSAAVFSVLGIASWLCRARVFSARVLTHMVLGCAAGAGLTIGFYVLLMLSEENLRAVAGHRLALKTIGAALLGVFLVPLVFSVLERLDQMMGNVVVESSV